MDRNRSKPPLEGVRVVDATNRWGEMAGRILAELGAEVLKVESSAGTESRRLPPMADGESMYWHALGAGKQSVVANDVRPFLRDADIFLESRRSEGLGDEFPNLIHVSITPWGTTGPYAGRPASELTVEAAGGLVNLQGNGDRAPVPMGSMPQAAFHAGAQAAADALVALRWHQRGGRGQHLDVSAQAAIVWTLMNATGYPPNTGRNPPGTSEYRGQGNPVIAELRLPAVVQCVDGYVLVRFQMAVIGERTFEALRQWVAREEEVPAAIAALDLSRWMTDLRAGALDAAIVQQAADLVVGFLERQTKLDLQTFAAKAGILLGAIYDAADLLADPHLADSEFWVEHADRCYAGPFAKLSRTPLSHERAAPALGSAAGFRSTTRVTVESTQCPERPFSGLRVADFSWVGVGPMIGKALADQGADVIRIESTSRMDLLRTVPPFKDGEPGPDRAQFMANFNSSKRGVTLDLKHPEGQRIARHLADWADVVLESFSPGTLARFGLDWQTLSADRTDLVMLSTCMRGQTGRERTYSGFGAQGAAIAGLFDLVGWPDRAPSGPWGAYTDFITPRFGVSVLTAALIERDVSGQGQYIDLSQIECGIRFLEPLILDYQASGRLTSRLGQGSHDLAPHGVFACAGPERYVAVGVETAAERVALDGVLEGQELADWCARSDAFEAAEILCAAGVPAAVVARPSDLYNDPQLEHREFFVTLDHPVMGATPYDGPVTRFSATPATLRSPAPLLGQHNEEVLHDVLGIDVARIRELGESGAFG